METAKEQEISDPAFSVIVPVRNRWGSRLRNCMKSLEIQTLQPLEIIVVDYGSTEQGHEAIMKTLDDFDCSVYYYRTDEVWSLATARNMGIRRSTPRCSNVVTVDTDLVLEPRVIEALTESHESTPRSYISSVIRMLLPKAWPHYKEFMENCMAAGRTQVDCVAEYRELNPGKLDETPDNFELPQDFAMLKESEFWPSAGRGGLVSAPRSWLFRVRGFDERMKFWGAEDRDLWKRAGLDGMNCYRINDLKQEDTEIYHQFHDDCLSWDQSRLTEEEAGQIKWNKQLADKDYTLIRNNDNWGLWGPRQKKPKRRRETKKVGHKISSSITSWNESKTIDLTLKSLADWAHEVIIVDTGSFDGTQKIAQEWLDDLNLSGQIIQMSKAFMNERKTASFKCRRARLVGYDACEGDWVLIHGAGFVLTEGLKRELKNHTREFPQYLGKIKSLNLMGDYEHYFKNRVWMAPHRVFIRKGTKHRPRWVSLPYFIGETRTLKGWATTLSRVRPAWRYYCRGEQFDRRYYKPPDGDWRNKANTQNRWARESFTPSLIEYLEETEGLTFEDIKKKAPAWMLRQLRLEATPLTEAMRKGLPEPIKEEIKNPRYKLVYEKGEIVGRWPEF